MKSKTSKAKQEYLEIDTKSLFNRKNIPTYIIVLSLICAFVLVLANGGLGFLGKDTDLSAFQYNEEIGTYETFVSYDNEVCFEDGKPLVIAFFDSGCSNCDWIDEKYDEWVKSRDDIKAYRYEWYTGDNHYTEEIESEIPSVHLQLFYEFAKEQKVPLFVFGCRYAREENAFEEENDLQKEFDTFNKVADALFE